MMDNHITLIDRERTTSVISAPNDPGCREDMIANDMKQGS